MHFRTSLSLLSSCTEMNKEETAIYSHDFPALLENIFRFTFCMESVWDPFIEIYYKLGCDVSELIAQASLIFTSNC